MFIKKKLTPTWGLRKFRKKTPRMFFYKVKKKQKYLVFLHNQRFAITNMNYNLLSVKTLKKFKAYYSYKMYYNDINYMCTLANKLKQITTFEELNLDIFEYNDGIDFETVYYSDLVKQNCLKYTKIAYYTDNIHCIKEDNSNVPDDDLFDDFEENLKCHKTLFKIYNLINHGIISTKSSCYKLNYLSTLLSIFKIKYYKQNNIF